MTMEEIYEYINRPIPVSSNEPDIDALNPHLANREDPRVFAEQWRQPERRVRRRRRRWLLFPFRVRLVRRKYTDAGEVWVP